MSANATRVDVLSLDGPGQAKTIMNLDLAGPAAKAGLKIGMCLNMKGSST